MANQSDKLETLGGISMLVMVGGFIGTAASGFAVAVTVKDYEKRIKYIRNILKIGGAITALGFIGTLVARGDGE